MVGPYECCDTLLTIKPVRNHTVALREASPTDDNGPGQRIVEIWSTHLPPIQKQPPSMSDNVVEEGRPFRR
jgi:hypothetical protein